MHSQYRILALPMPRIGIASRFLLKDCCVLFLLIFFLKNSFCNNIISSDSNNLNCELVESLNKTTAKILTDVKLNNESHSNMMDIVFDITDSSCSAIPDGSISITSVLCSQSGLLYQWTDPSGNVIPLTQNTTTLNGLLPGTYSVTATSSACNLSGTATVGVGTGFEVTDTIITNASCLAVNNGAISITTSNPTVPGSTYAYSWSDGFTQSTPIRTDLAPGSYTVTIEESTGCISTETYIVGDGPGFEVTDTIITNASCLVANNGAISLTTSNSNVPGSTYAYSWSDGFTQSTPIRTDLAPGSYTVTIEESTGCVSTETYVVGDGPGFEVTDTIITNASCLAANNGAISITASNPTHSGTTFAYSWSDGFTQSTPIRTGLTPGIYMVTIEESTGCVSTETYVVGNGTGFQVVETITKPSCPDAANGAISLSISNPDAPGSTYVYEWDGFTQSTPIITNLAAGTYPIKITESTGCTSMLSFVVMAEPDTIAPICLVNEVKTKILDPGICVLNNIGSDLLPTAGMDNCDPNPIITLTTAIPPLGFMIGAHVITYDLGDKYGNTATCEYTLIIDQSKPDELICVGSINHSLNTLTCSGSLTLADVIGTNVVSCPDDCQLRILDEYGVPIPNDFDLDDVGETYQYELCCGGVCCWGDLTIEYKGTPTFICNSVEIETNCIILDSIPPPAVTSQCLPPSVELISEIVNNQDCALGNDQEILRTYQIVTANGPTNETCTQKIIVKAADLSLIQAPEKQVIGCLDSTDPSVIGAPVYCFVLGTRKFRIPLIPDSLRFDCSVFVNYEDNEFGTSCGKTIFRQWNIAQWTCGVESDTSFLQRIEVTDINPPVVDCPPDSLVFSTNTLNCQAAVTLPSVVATDDCADILEYSISTPGGVVRENGGIVLLPIDEYDIVYRISDCSNETVCRVAVEVKDLTPPVAICESDLKIGFGEVGNTFLHAYKLDGGSYDDCDTATYLIARMDDALRIEDHPFADKILIECSDVDTSFMAILQTMDKRGNTSYCMVSVCVQDKNEAKLTCPPTAVVACDTIFNESNLSVFFGDYVVTDNCPDRFSVKEDLVGERNECGIGELTRMIEIFNKADERIGICNQKIVFEQIDTLAIQTVIDACPKPIGPIEMCDFPTDLDEEVVIDSAPCQLLGFSMTLDTLTPLEVNASGLLSCMAIERCWNFIDWCKEEGVLSKLEPYRKCDTVQLVDVVKPVITGLPMDGEKICFFSPTCEDEAHIMFDSPRVNVDCSGIDSTSYRIFDMNNNLIASGEGLIINEMITAGEYRISWYAEDACGNVTNRNRQIIVENCKGPTLSCIAGIVVPLTSSSSGPPSATIEIKSLVAAAFHACDYDVITSFSEVPFASTQVDTTLTYTCNDDISEPIEVEIYAIDENDRSSHCTTTISISENGLCPALTASAIFKVEGAVSTFNGRYIPDVEVMMEGETIDRRFTDNSGTYNFGSMPSGGEYQIHAKKSEDFLKGVSIMDLILIQQHIIGIRSLDDPYLMLAADVNFSGSVTIADIIMLQRMLIGSQSEPNVDEGWIFVDESYVFTDPDSPFGNDMPISIDIPDLNKDLNANFIGIKLGDIDGSGMSNVSQSETRFTDTHRLWTENRILERAQSYRIPIYSDNIADLRGLELSLKMNDATIKDIHSAQLDITYASAVSNKNLKMTLPVANGIDVSDDIPLFYLTIEADYTGSISDMMQLEYINTASQIIRSENLESQNLELNFSQRVAEIDISIHPNPWKNLTKLKFNSNLQAEAHIYITNTNGQIVYQLRQTTEPDRHTIELTQDILPHPGVYFIHIDSGNMTATEKMIKLE